MTQPLVSVILPTLNRAELLARSAGSVLAQTYRNLELIVVDDGSSEDIAAAVRALADPRTRYVRRERNSGAAAARNTGLAHAQGEYVAFQDSDDEWLLDKLSIQVRALQSDPSHTMSLGSMFRVIDHGFRVFRQESDGVVSLERIADQAIAYTQTWLVKRRALLDAGGFDERLSLWDDWDLLLRLATQFRIVGSARAIAISERRADSLTQAKQKFIEDAQYIIGKHWQIFSKLPRQSTQLHYMLALRVFDAEGPGPAARAFRQVLQADPFHLKSWIYWVLCTLRARSVILRLRGALSKQRGLES